MENKVISFLITAIYFGLGFYFEATAESINYFFLPFFALSWMSGTGLRGLSIFLYLVGFAAMWTMFFYILNGLRQSRKKT